MKKIADYELIRSLGCGNHGEFFLAEPPARLGLKLEHVAVKVLGGPSSEDAFRRATRELRMFAAVPSPYLVELYDAGQDGGRFFYSMAYFPRGSLAAPEPAANPAEVLRAVACASRAAHALHEAGIVHRGIKPANVLLDNGGARLSDLGLAQVITPGISVTGIGPVDSIEYVDPAVLRGEPASRASDIWSLGVTLHRALTGDGVYAASSASDTLAIVRKVLTDTPRVSDELTTAESELVASCLAPDPADRPLTAQELAERIDATAAAA